MRGRRTSLLACAAFAAATMTAGCGSTGTVKHPSALGGGHGNNDPSFHYPRTATVVIRDDGYHPRRLNVGVDTTVRWVNSGSRSHSVSWSGGSAPHFSSGRLAPGQSFKVRLPHVATLRYGSKRDSRRRGVIEVG